MDQTNQTEFLKWMPAKWTVHEDNGCVILQIELGNDHALTLRANDDGCGNGVAMWHGSGEHPFMCDEAGLGEPEAALKAWLAEAAEGIDPVPPPTAPDHQQRRSFF